MAMSTRDILLKHVCPALGDVIALIMFSSPLKAVLQVNRTKCLGELNALPFIAMAVNCTAWIVYAFLIRDFYIYFGNIPGLLFGMFYCLTCYKFSKEQAQDMLRNLYLGSCFLLFVVGLAQLAADMDFYSSKTLWGSTCVAILAVYYTAPLSSLAKVISQRDSSSLHWPLCSMNIINGMLWFAYGLALKDYFVALPNGIGAGFNAVCLVFCFIFPAKSRSSRTAGQTDVTSNWGVLRLQSARRQLHTGSSSNLGTQRRASIAGGFFDLTEFRWRTGHSFKLGSSRGQCPAQSEVNVPVTLPGNEVTQTVKEQASSMPLAAVAGDDVRVKDVEAGYVAGDHAGQPGAVSSSEDVGRSSGSSSAADIVAVVPDVTPAAALDSNRVVHQ